MTTVLFACVHNAGRSQMAAAWFTRFADADVARAVSAGTQPADRVHPAVVSAMHEVGIDLSAARPRRLTDSIARDASLLVTLGCGGACPFIPGLDVQDWPVADPNGRAIDEVRAIRDELRDRVRALVTERGWRAATAP